MAIPGIDHDKRLSGVGRGIGWFVLGLLLLTLMDAAAKSLVTRNINPAQIIALRAVIIVPALLIILLARGQLGEIKTRKPIPLLARGLLGFFAPFCFFKSLEVLPLADAVVVFFSSVFMSAALSIPILKERVGVHRWTAIVIGFVGVFIAMRPEGTGQIYGYVLVQLAALAYSIMFLSGRKLSRTESVTALVFSFTLITGLAGAVLLPWVWVPMSGDAVIILVVLATFAFMGHLAITKAFAMTEVSALAPFEYTAIIWATVLGYVFWGDVPKPNVWIGVTIIVICGIYVAYRESLRPKH